MSYREHVKRRNALVQARHAELGVVYASNPGEPPPVAPNPVALSPEQELAVTKQQLVTLQRYNTQLEARVVELELLLEDATKPAA